jgi:hypothetical protein
MNYCSDGMQGRREMGRGGGGGREGGAGWRGDGDGGEEGGLILDRGLLVGGVDPRCFGLLVGGLDPRYML